MTTDQKNKCNVIIHGASASAGAIGAGLAQLPCSDTAALIPLQIAMVVALGKVFDKHITETAAKGCALGAAGGYAGRFVSQVLVGWIPVIGNAINATTAAGITEFIGWKVAGKFAKE